MITPDDGGDGYDQYDGGQIPDFSSDSYYKSGACKTRRVLTFFFFMDDSWGFSISFPKKKMESRTWCRDRAARFANGGPRGGRYHSAAAGLHMYMYEREREREMHTHMRSPLETGAVSCPGE